MNRLPAALLLVLLVPPAGAWTLQAGVIVQYDGTMLTFASDVNVTGTLTFEDMDGGVIIDGYTLDLQTPSSWSWVVLNWSLPFNLTIQGNNSVSGTFRLEGVNGLYTVRGLAGQSDFVASGPTILFDVPAGNQTITLTPLGAFMSGVRVDTDADYSPRTLTVGVTAVILNSDGSPIRSASPLLRIVTPQNGLYAQHTMNESTVPGVYYSNVTIGTDEGPWLVAVSFGDHVAGQIVVVSPSPIAETDTLEVEIAQSAASELLPWVGLLLAIALLWAAGHVWGPGFSFIGALLAIIAALTSLASEPYPYQGYFTPFYLVCVIGALFSSVAEYRKR